MEVDCLDFNSEDIDSYREFFAENGYVVIKNVLDSDSIQNTVNEIWGILQSNNDSIRADDPETWSNEVWPSKGVGFLDTMAGDTQFKQIWNNRQNPKIIEIFRNILGTSDILVKRDRFGILRPTKDIKLKDGAIVQREDWKTKQGWLHWDQNPWSEKDIFRLQGMILLTDHTDTSGGFECVPKFHHEWNRWSEDNPVSDVEGATPYQGLVYVPKHDPLQSRVKNINGKAGSLLIWNSKLPHQNFPNNDHTFRIVQYLTYLVYTKEEMEGIQDNLFKQVRSAILPKDFIYSLTELGRKVSGFQLYDQERLDIDNLVLEENAVEAAQLALLASSAERNGDPVLAASYFRKAYKLNPLLEEIDYKGTANSEPYQVLNSSCQYCKLLRVV